MIGKSKAVVLALVLAVLLPMGDSRAQHVRSLSASDVGKLWMSAARQADDAGVRLREDIIVAHNVAVDSERDLNTRLEACARLRDDPTVPPEIREWAELRPLLIVREQGDLQFLIQVVDAWLLENPESDFFYRVMLIPFAYLPVSPLETLPIPHQERIALLERFAAPILQNVDYRHPDYIPTAVHIAQGLRNLAGKSHHELYRELSTGEGMPDSSKALLRAERMDDLLRREKYYRKAAKAAQFMRNDLIRSKPIAMKEKDLARMEKNIASALEQIERQLAEEAAP